MRGEMHMEMPNDQIKQYPEKTREVVLSLLKIDRQNEDQRPAHAELRGQIRTWLMTLLNIEKLDTATAEKLIAEIREKIAGFSWIIDETDPSSRADYIFAA